MKSVLFAAGALLLLSVFTTTACKDSHDEGDTEAPAVTVLNPTEGAAYTAALDIDVDVTDESLHEMSVKVTKDSDASVVFEDDPTVHDETHYIFTHSLTFSGLAGDTPMTLTVVVEDHNANKTTKTVHFTAKP